MKKVIGFKTAEQQKHEQAKQRKQKLYNDALELVQRVISVDDPEAFKNDFTGYLKAEFKRQHSGLFPSELVTIEKALENVDFPLHILTDIQNEYRRLFIPDEVDFNIYVEGEAVPVYERLEAVCKAVNESKKDRYMQLGGIVQAFGGSLMYDFETQTLKPNVQYFTQALHRAG